MKIINWIGEQDYIQGKNWSTLASDKSNSIWTDVEEHLEFINNKTNSLRSVHEIDWDSIFHTINKTNCVVADIGCGMGWLSAFLAKRKDVSKINCIDSDLDLLNKVPEMFKLFRANTEKIRLIHGKFQPILFDDNSIDIIVASASMHHSDDLQSLLKECYRVLSDNGYLVILNENPLTKVNFLLIFIRKSLHMLFSIFLGKGKSSFQKISNVGILYDPVLGDWDYPLYTWRNFLKNAKFEFEIIDTCMQPYTEKKIKHTLKHIVCRPK
jgi:ubiquinone/menaquinone biosynthesis C-methylase UbiE